MEYYFDPDDKLERKRYAEFLKSMLENCDQYRREDSDGAYVIAIDSPWGTGKTRFAKMLRNYLEGREPIITNGKVDQSYCSVPSDTRKFNVIYYNSWETDYWNDALEPLISSILESQIFEVEGSEEDYKQIETAVLQILKGVGLALIKIAIGEPGAAVFQGALEGLEKTPEDPLRAFKDRLAQYKKFREALESVIKRTKKKLVIVVDELDRCRPTFAIQTLELAKHLFAVPNLVFIFALDVEQLSCSVKTIYGLNMDASGYLCRFFDYIGKMPNPNQRVFIKMCLEKHRAFTSPIENWNQKIPDYITALSISYSLSLRDITTIIKTYQLMLDSFLFEYKYSQFHLLYLFLLTLKYKNGALYSEFLLQLQNERTKKNESNSLTRVKNYLPDVSSIENNVLVDQLQRLSTATNLSRAEFAVFSNLVDIKDRKTYSTHFLIDAARMETDKRGNPQLTITPRVKNSSSAGMHLANPHFFDNSDVLSDVLEINDLIKWESIKNKSLGQYYYQQLEMFNFALPADEPTTQP